jgi:phage baseplate assembly protein W
LGLPYPTEKTALGYWYSQSGINQIKSDMLTLLLTNPGERVMLPNYGTPLKRLIFEQNDEASSFTAKDMIAQSIALWEPRVAITNITVSNQVDTTSLNIDDDLSAAGHILFIRIEFVDPENIKEVQELVLNVPLSS